MINYDQLILNSTVEIQFNSIHGHLPLLIENIRDENNFSLNFALNRQNILS